MTRLASEVVSVSDYSPASSCVQPPVARDASRKKSGATDAGATTAGTTHAAAMPAGHTRRGAAPHAATVVFAASSRTRQLAMDASAWMQQIESGPAPDFAALGVDGASLSAGEHVVVQVKPNRGGAGRTAPHLLR